MRTAAIYCRVSTDKQEKNGVSLDAQLVKCSTYAKAEGLDVVKVGVEAESAKDTDRPELQAILKMVAQKKVTHIITIKLDRLTRDVHDGAGIAKTLAKKGCSLHLVSEGGYIDFTDPASEAMYNMRLSMGQFERRRISLNTKLAMDHLKSENRKASRFAPYGYQFEGSDVVANPEEQSTISRIKAMAKSGLSQRKLIDALASVGVVNREGNPFTRPALAKILAA